MTYQEINKAIAEFCGWKHEFNGDHEDPEWYWIPPYNPDGNGNPPNYCNNLNAMREAELKLNNIEYDAYFNELVALCVEKGWERMNSCSAHMRAEAFAKAIGKWKK
jgi:hypothetical protein